MVLVGCTAEPVEQPGVAENLDAASAAELLKSNPAVVVLDVRTPGEYAAGHIPGGVLVDFQAADFAERLGELDRDRSYLVHCQSGGRSSTAFEQMKELGFTSIYHLDGGMRAWQKAEQLVVK